jgi:hypothetical protein
MTDEQIALARRAVACKGWRWMPGMLAVEWSAPGMSLTGGRPVRVDDGWHEVGVWLPDLSDPATLGCLLALVREAWGDPHASVWYDSEYWQSGNRWSWHAKEHSLCDYDTEAEALVAALEAAP